MLNKSNRHPISLGLAVADIAAASLALYVAYLLRVHVLIRYPLWSGRPVLYPTYLILLLGTLPIILASLYLSGAYDLATVRSRSATLIALFKAGAASSVGAMSFAFLLRDRTFSRAIVAGYVLLSLLLQLTSRLVVRHFLATWHRQGKGLQRLLVVGTDADAIRLANLIENRPYLGYKIAGFVATDCPPPTLPYPLMGHINDLPQLVDHNVIDAVLFATTLEESARYERLIWELEEVGITVHLRGDAIGVLLSRTYIGDFEGTPILTFRSTPADPLALAAKRAIDITVSALALVIFSPLFLLTAIAIKVTSPGPIIYRQLRVGLNGRTFYMLKFRSMYIDAEARLQELLDKNEMDGPAFKIKNDPRITPIGRWIRKFSIDELPQLINVLRGEMSLVGPRPPLPHEVAQYKRWQRRRLSMKPGITCLWQVSGRNDIDFETWMKLDLEYIDNWSLLLDFYILLRTIPAVLLARGAS